MIHIEVGWLVTLGNINHDYLLNLLSATVTYRRQAEQAKKCLKSNDIRYFLACRAPRSTALDLFDLWELVADPVSATDTFRRLWALVTLSDVFCLPKGQFLARTATLLVPNPERVLQLKHGSDKGKKHSFWFHLHVWDTKKNYVKKNVDGQTGPLFAASIGGGLCLAVADNNYNE